MFSHSQIWGALDKLAESKGMSVSALAKAAGLDATSFNKSKRITSAGRKRWPTTESIAKCLNATGATLDEFTAMVEGVPATNRTIPVIGLAQAGGGGFFDDSGFPVGGSWDEINLPTVADPNAYALEISGDSMEPVLPQG
jgi:phage repressor protein C with HTH and peptisase S24 domain